MPAQQTTFRDFYLNNLKDGRESPRLEFTADYYRLVVKLSGGRLVNLLQEKSDAARLLAPRDAVTTAISVFHPELEDHIYDHAYKGLASRYRDVAKLAVHMFQTSPDNFDIEAVPVEQNLSIPPSELQEVARLAIEKYRVYTAIAETGEVPEL